MAHCFDVVAVGIANKCAEVVLVVLGPQTRTVENLRPVIDRRVEETLYLGTIASNERQMRLAEALTSLAGTDPERRSPVDAVADHRSKFHDPTATEGGQHDVVERGTGVGIGALY